jgi:hypothetical protein
VTTCDAGSRAQAFFSIALIIGSGPRLDTMKDRIDAL